MGVGVYLIENQSEGGALKLGLSLFVAYINRLNSNTVCQILIFADDMKVHSEVKRHNNDNNLQKDFI